MFEVRNITKTFGSEIVLDGVAFSFEQGQRVGIIGNSGEGKSTLSKILCGYQKCDSGEFLYNGEVLNDKELPKIIQYIPQLPFAYLERGMTVEQSVIEPLKYFGVVSGKKELEKRAEELLNLVGFDIALKKRTPFALSGGQAQRVVLARALATNPKLLILDECTAMLDMVSQKEIVNFLNKYCREKNISLIVITHDRHLAWKMTDIMLKLDGGKLSRIESV